MSDPNPGDVVEKILGEFAYLGSANQPQPIRDAYTDLGSALRSELAVTTQLRADRAELDSKRDLLPAAGYERLHREATEAATSAARERDRVARSALDAIATTLEQRALPTLPPDRETLARGEAELALRSAPPHEALSSMSREAAAAVLSPWGRSALRAAGVEDPAATQADLRKLAIAQAAENGESAQMLAAKQLQKLPKLGAAIGAAGLELYQMTETR